MMKIFLALLVLAGIVTMNGCETKRPNEQSSTVKESGKTSDKAAGNTMKCQAGKCAAGKCGSK